MADYLNNEIKKCHDYEEQLGHDVTWSVDMQAFPDWTLETMIIPSISPLKLISSGIGWQLQVTAKNGTVRELWKAADEAYKKASKSYGDWHYFIEKFHPDPTDANVFHMWFGS